MLQKMGNFSSRLSFKMRPRRKISIFQDSPKNVGDILASPFVSKMDPSDSYSRLKIGQIWGAIWISGGDLTCCRKWAILIRG